MGDFFSPAALRVIAEDYQQGLLDRLNEQIKGAPAVFFSQTQPHVCGCRHQPRKPECRQIVISTAPHESQTLAFNYASLALNNSFFLHHLVIETANADSRNHEAALDEKYPYLNPEQMTLGGVIASQMGSLQDLKTYVTAAATGMLSSNGFVWLVTDSTGNLGVLATYGAGTLLVGERLQTFSPSSTELGGTYVPAENLTAASPEQPEAPASGLAPPPLRTEPPAGVRAFSTSALVRSTVGGGVGRPANVWSDAASAGLRTGRGGLGQTLFPLFCVSVHEHAWMAGGYGVWGRGRIWSASGRVWIGRRAGCVCAV
ncbi:hypothetical protein BC826DRAFT_1166307 [Russula brevipes]|nr:hypothetical protein BC826DRAFT_1166307 [Russula brevipes]